MTWQTISNAPTVRRIVNVVCCVAAFMVMASVITPDRSRAADPQQSLQRIPPRSVEHPALVNHQNGITSANPHEGLLSLGVIESSGYILHIYATEDGPRYTIYQRDTGTECGALLSQEQVHRAFPDLQLPDMEFNAEGPLMIADDRSSAW